MMLCRILQLCHQFQHIVCSVVCPCFNSRDCSPPTLTRYVFITVHLYFNPPSICLYNFAACKQLRCSLYLFFECHNAAAAEWCTLNKPPGNRSSMRRTIQRRHQIKAKISAGTFVFLIGQRRSIVWCLHNTDEFCFIVLLPS